MLKARINIPLGIGQQCSLRFHCVAPANLGQCSAACTHHRSSWVSTCQNPDPYYLIPNLRVVLQARAGLSPGNDAALREFAGAVAEWSRAMGALGAGWAHALTCSCSLTVLLDCDSYPTLSFN